MLAFQRMAKWQSTHAECAQTFGRALSDSALFTEAIQHSSPPAAEFGSGSLAGRLRVMATVLPYFRACGYRRQVFLVAWSAFESHAVGIRRAGEWGRRDRHLAQPDPGRG